MSVLSEEYDWLARAHAKIMRRLKRQGENSKVLNWRRFGPVTKDDSGKDIKFPVGGNWKKTAEILPEDGVLCLVYLPIGVDMLRGESVGPITAAYHREVEGWIYADTPTRVRFDPFYWIALKEIDKEIDNKWESCLNDNSQG